MAFNTDHNQAPKKARGRTVRSVAAVIVLAVAVAVFAVSAWRYTQDRGQYQAQAAVNDRLAAYAEVSDDPAGPQGPVVDWAGLKAVNDDVVAWLQVPGTQINYPVYQGETNDDYLRTNAEGEYSIGGQVFMDCENSSPDFAERQVVAYGHHLKDGSMFFSVSRFDEQEFFDSMPTVWWVTEQGAYEMAPLFCYRVRANDLTVRTFDFAAVDDFRAYLGAQLARAVTSRPDAAEVLARTDNVLTLSTCNYIDGKGRTVVVCAPKEALGENGAPAA